MIYWLVPHNICWCLFSIRRLPAGLWASCICCPNTRYRDAQTPPRHHCGRHRPKIWCASAEVCHCHVSTQCSKLLQAWTAVQTLLALAVRRQPRAYSSTGMSRSWICLKPHLGFSILAPLLACLQCNIGIPATGGKGD